ncbi:MAG: 3'(2'),5'-bisphosphate nucleotidase CysQ [Pyrinomonadaceae bacterium]
MFEHELKIAKHLARKAGSSILEFRETGFEVERKPMYGDVTEPVTIADKTSSAIIVEGIDAAFPDDAVLSEEEPDNIGKRLSSERVWIIDPLDGTKGFVEGAGDFAVQIGLARAGRAVVGVVYQPVGDAMFFASEGGGAWLEEAGKAPERLTVSEIGKIRDMTMAVSRSHRSEKMGRVLSELEIGKEIRHGSVGLKVGLIAKRNADVYLHLSPHTKFWDSAAPEIIVEEAGGTITDIFGNRMDYSLADVRNHNGVLVSNNRVHDEIVERLRPLLNEFGRLRIKSKG